MDHVLVEALKSAIRTFYCRDFGLIECKGTERSCVFRIGIYLQEIMNRRDELRELSLDNEYNKKEKDPKKLDGTLIRPDLIIHKRGSNDSNKLVVEFKGWWNEDGDDIEKLEKLTNTDFGYSYGLAIFVRLGKTEKDVKYRYFKGGGELCRIDKHDSDFPNLTVS